MQLIDLLSEKLAGGLLISLLVLGVAHAKDDGTDHSLTIESENHSYVVNTDGGFVSTHDRISRINEERAIKGAAQQSLNYNHTLESLDVVEAYTQKADGRKVMVLPEQIKDQQERQSSDAPMFQDTRVKVVIYSEVAVGDQLILKYTLHRTTALFPGQFEDLSYPDFHPTKQLSITYDMPDNLPLLADAKGFTASTPVNAAGRTIYQWTYVSGDNARIEQGAVSYLDYGKYLAVSTFTNVGSFAHAYDSRAKDKSSAEAKVTELAHKITANVNDPRAKAIALDDWVRKNIRYVAVYIGAGGVVPHAADTILSNRYGDCKDHVALLEALLAAAGIDSTPALINASNAYALPKVFTLGLLNHVITYIPSLNLYLDSTAESIAGGYLPAADLDKPVVLTKTGKLAHTPSVQDTFAKSTMVFKISASGAADFTLSSSVTGWLAEPSRHSLRNTKPADLDLVVQRILTAYGQKGSGTVDTGKLDGAGSGYEFKLAGKTENLVNVPGPVGVPALSSFVGGIAQAVVGFTGEKERTQAFACISSAADEQSRFDFPKEISIAAVPKKVQVHDAYFDYTADYTQEANVIAVSRHYEFHHTGAVCSPAEFKAMQPAMDTMLRDLKSQIIVQAR